MVLTPLSRRRKVFNPKILGSKVSRHFSVGKVPPSSLLRAVYPYVGLPTRRLLIRPGVGRDVSAISYGEKVLVFSTDPITGTATRIGRHSVHINANDIATAGAKPKWYLCTILLPPNTLEESLRQIMRDMDRAARSLEISIVGGHTEVTPSLRQPIVAGFMVGETSKRRLVSAEGGREGDRILLTKTAGLEGTAILAMDHANRLRRIRPEILARARKFSGQISIVKEALSIAKARGVHAMHDPTEGGVLNGIWEMAEASELGVESYAHKIPITAETRTISRTLRLNPLKLMSSGALLIAVHPAKADHVRQVLRRTKVHVAEIGKLVPVAQGRRMLIEGKWRALEPVSKDELYKLG